MVVQSPRNEDLYAGRWEGLSRDKAGREHFVDTGIMPEGGNHDNCDRKGKGRIAGFAPSKN